MRRRWIKGLSQRPIPPRTGYQKFEDRAQTFAAGNPRPLNPYGHQHGELYLEHYSDGSHSNRRWCEICNHPHAPYEFCEHFGEAIIADMAQEELSSIVGIPQLVFDPDPMLTTNEQDVRNYSTPRLVEYRQQIRQLRMNSAMRDRAFDRVHDPEEARRVALARIGGTVEETARLLAARRILRPAPPRENAGVVIARYPTSSLCRSCTFRRDERVTTDTTVYCGYHHERLPHRSGCPDYIYENAPGIAGQPRTELPAPGTACSSCVNANHINTTSDMVACNVFGNVTYRWSCSAWARRHRG